jgi:hypothetical protein
MNNPKQVDKYKTAIEIILFCVENNPKISFTKLRKELKINKNVFTSLLKLGIIKNTGTKRQSNYILLKKYNHSFANEVLNYANDLSANKKQPIIEKHFGIDTMPKRTLLQRFFDLFKF